MTQKQIEKWIDQLQGEIDAVRSGSLKRDQIPSVTPDQSGPELTDAAAAYVNKLVATIEPIQVGSGDPSPDNVRAITGTSQLVILRRGKNLLPPFSSVEKNGVTVSVDSEGIITLNGTCTEIFNVVVSLALKAGTYKLSGAFGNSDFYKGQTMGGSNRLFITVNGANYFDNVAGGRQFIVSEDTTANVNLVIVASESSGVIFNDSKVYPMIYPASIPDPTFEPYLGHSLTISLGRTVYGGTLDVTTGELVVDTVSLALGTLTWTAYSSESRTYYSDTIADIAADKTSICNSYKGVLSSPSDLNDGEYRLSTNNRFYIRDTDYSGAGAFKNHLTDDGVYATYKLATPQRFQLTPKQIKLLAGYNYITSNAAALAISYEKSSPFDGLLARMDGLYDALQIQIDGLDERVTALEGNSTTAPLVAAENKKTLTKRRTK